MADLITLSSSILYCWQTVHGVLDLEAKFMDKVRNRFLPESFHG